MKAKKMVGGMRGNRRGVLPFDVYGGQLVLFIE
jgi:hypothetical protein